MGTFSVWHMLIVLAVALLLFGAGRVSELGKGMGEGIRAFKKGLRDEDEVSPAAKGEAPAPRDAGAGTAPLPRRSRVIEIEVDEGADESEIRATLAQRRRELGQSG